MARDGYSSVSLNDEEITQHLDQLASEKQAEQGGKWERPAVIKFLLDFYKKHGTTNNIKEGSHRETSNPQP